MPNVLVIDDSSEVRSVIVSTLEHFGFVAREAPDGIAGLDQALAAPPDLIICDVRMPGMDGYQTLAAVRDQSAIANVPFIFLTAAIDKHEVRRGMVSGADDYLPKPFTAEELLEAVTARLSRQAELKSEMFKHAEKLRHDVVHLFSQECVGPLDGIGGLTSTLIRDYAILTPETIRGNARQINEYVTRLNQLAQSLD